MHLDEPRWWYRAPASGTANLLRPLGALYGWAARTRYLRARSYRSRLPVICVGNFTAGGTGKTPLTIYLSEQLKAAGHEPVVLTRGYGGRLSGPYWVDARTDNARNVGDEPLLLARAAPTLVARDRAAGARAIESGPHPATVILMDDGLQNPTLAKDFSIAVVDGARGVGNGLVMPAGPLRAPLEFQLELTDAIIVNEVDSASGPSAVTGWLRQRFAGPVLRASMIPSQDVDWLAGLTVVAWAGIGAPGRFFSTLRGLGARLVETVSFRDHQRLTHADAARLLETALLQSATLVTTAKDMARLAGAEGALAELAATSRVLDVKLQLTETDAERLFSFLSTSLKAGS